MTSVLATITVPALLLFASVAAAESPGPLRGPGQSPTVQSTAATAENDTVAVTIFSNISGATEDEWVGAGIVETLTADFERLAGVSVVGGQAGAGARWVISGAYQRLDERMRITARVVEVATDAVVHTAIVDGSVAELFALQDQLSAELSRGLTAATMPPRQVHDPAAAKASADSPRHLPRLVQLPPRQTTGPAHRAAEPVE